MPTATLETKYLELEDAAKELGYEYESFLKVYTPLMTKNDVGIYQIPGTRRKLINRKEFYDMIASHRIN